MSDGRSGRAAPVVAGAALASSSNCGTCCAGRVRCSASACWCSAGFVAGVIFWGGFNTALEAHQHREVLHRLPRDARQRVRGTEDRPSTSPTAPACARAARTATSRTTGPTRSRARCRPRRRSGARSSAPSTRREKFVDHRLELALHEWARFKANDSLECRNCHSAQSMDITKQIAARRRWRTSASCSPARRPASTATRASPTICPTCAASRAGNSAAAVRAACAGGANG